MSKYFDKFGSYYAFLVRYYGNEYEVRLSSAEGPASTGNMKVAVVINDEGYEFKGSRNQRR